MTKDKITETDLMRAENQAMHADYKAEVSRLLGEVVQRVATMQSDIDRRLAEMQSDIDRRFAEMQSNIDRRLAEMQSSIDKRDIEAAKRETRLVLIIAAIFGGAIISGPGLALAILTYAGGG